MSTITSLGANDTGATSRGVINTNFTNLNTDKIETSVLDTDVTLSANSDSKVATQKAVKAYVDTELVATDISCHIYQTAGTTVGENFTVLDFGAELFDTDTMHDNSINPSRITFTTAGKYLVGGTVRITGSNQDAGILIRLGGTTELACTNAPAGQADGGGASASVLYSFTAGQYVEFLASRGQDGSGSTTGDAKTNAWAIKIN